MTDSFTTADNGAVDFNSTHDGTNMTTDVINPAHNTTAADENSLNSTYRNDRWKRPSYSTRRPTEVADGDSQLLSDPFSIVEATAQEELKKRQDEKHPLFFLSSANEEWILLEKPLTSPTLQRMQKSYWLTRIVRQ